MCGVATVFSFPGGFTELADTTPVATALREAEEELGLPASLVDVWGQLPIISDRVSTKGTGENIKFCMVEG